MDCYRKRILWILGIFSAVVVVVAFLNLQMDDERYFGRFEYSGVSDAADFTDGVINITDGGLKEGDVIASIPAMHVDAGSFTIDVDHQNEQDLTGVVYDGDTEIGRFTLPSSETNTRYPFRSDRNLYNLKVDYLYSGSGTATLKRTILYSDGPFYSDTVFFAVLIILCAALIAAFLIRKDFFTMSTEDKILCGVLILFVIFINYPFFRPFPAKGNDIGYHVTRIEGIYNGIRGGQFPVELYTDVMHGRGMIGTLYPHLFFAIPAMFRFLHVSMEAAFRTWLIMINVATCATSYYAAKTLLGRKKLALIAMILYCLLPYRITVLTWRYSYAEGLAFLFLPLVIAGLYEVLCGNRKWMVLAIGMTGMIQSHVASAMMIAVFCALAGLVYLRKIIVERRILPLLFSIVATFLLNLWFIMPFLYYYASDIDVRSAQAGDLSNITYFASQMFQLLPGNNAAAGQLFHQVSTIGLWLILLLAVAVYLLFMKREPEDQDRFALLLMLTGAAFVFSATKIFPWQTVSKFSRFYEIVSTFGYATRFLFVGEGLLFFGVILSFTNFAARPALKRALFFTAIGVAVLQGFLITDLYLTCEQPFIDARAYRFIPNTCDDMEYDWYAPEGYDHENFPDRITSPDARIEGYTHINTHTSFSYTSANDTYADVPLTYFLGYTANNDGTALSVSKGDKGCIRIALPKTTEQRTVTIDFTGYRFSTLTLIISLLTGAGMIVCKVCHSSKNKENPTT